MDMPFRMYHTLYRSAWLESMEKAKEAEDMEKEAKQQNSSKGKNKGSGRKSAGEVLDALRGGDMEELAEELGMD